LALPAAGLSRAGAMTRPGVRIEAVARLAGVSPITVSRALGNPGRVSDATRQKVAAAVAATGYVVNPAASSLKSGRSTIIAAFVSSLQNPHFATAVQGCAEALEGSRFHLLMAQTSYSDRLEQELLESILPLRPAALLFTGLVQSAETRARLRDLGIPIMEMWDFVADPLDMLVGFSNFDGGRLMGEHFGQRGFRRIAFVGRTLDRGAQRLAGFAAGLAAHGGKAALVLPLEGPRQSADGAAAFDQVLQQLPACDAIFFATDLLAIGAAFRARERQIAIPSAIAIAGFGDLEIARHLYCPLTTIAVPSHALGLAAGRLLRQRLEGRTAPVPPEHFPVELAIRQSTGTGRQ
jgi:LacI family gluconate utilization system Gnt-I transcriptional repressor